MPFLFKGNPFDLGKKIVFVGENGDRFKSVGFFDGHVSVGNDDEDISDLAATRGGSVQSNDATAACTGDDVSLDAFTVVVVDDLHALSLDHARGIHQVHVNGDGSYVIEVGFRHTALMNLASVSLNQHIGCVSIMLRRKDRENIAGPTSREFRLRLRSS